MPRQSRHRASISVPGAAAGSQLARSSMADNGMATAWWCCTGRCTGHCPARCHAHLPGGSGWAHRIRLTLLAQRAQLIKAPCILLVSTPRMLHGLLDCLPPPAQRSMTHHQKAALPRQRSVHAVQYRRQAAHCSNSSAGASKHHTRRRGQQHSSIPALKSCPSHPHLATSSGLSSTTGGSGCGGKLVGSGCRTFLLAPAS